MGPNDSEGKSWTGDRLRGPSIAIQYALGNIDVRFWDNDGDGLGHFGF
jgi:hypothetical protein